MPALQGLARSATALAAALAITLCGTAPAAGDPAQAGEGAPPERIAALVHPALVRVTGSFSGRVRDEAGAYANGGEPFSFSFTCSGFGVHPDGYLATVGHCVDANDRSVRWEFVRQVAQQLVARGTDLTVEQIVEHGRSAWIVEGPDGGPVQSEIRVTGIAGTPPDGLLARVVDDRPMGQGDVALLKVDITNMPALELATGPGIAVGTRLFAVGYGDSAGDPVQPDAQPRIEGGTAEEALADQGRPVYRIDTALEDGIDGGPAVDESGRVVGLNSVVSNETEQLSLVVPGSTFTDLLGRNGVRAELGPRDLLYREALAAYDAGEYTDVVEVVDRMQQEGPTHPRIGALRTDAEAARAEHGDASENRLARIGVWAAVAAGILLVVVVGVLLVVRSRRRKRAVSPPPPWPPYPGPPPGGPWPGGPGGSFPPHAGQQVRAPGAPGHPFRPAAHPQAPGHPVPAPQRPGPFDGVTRPVRMPAPAWPPAPGHPGGSENVTTRITLPTSSTPPAGDEPAPEEAPPGEPIVENVTTRITLPTSSTPPAGDEPAPEEAPPGERSVVDDADGVRSQDPVPAAATDHVAPDGTAEVREKPE